ncbi:MAG: type II toxin-antitoxin system VapC family toxin [Myxococcota bacterium]|nr:type II toxin-antitoxin system VapC family toxin [Myxococcota bacterium]
MIAYVDTSVVLRIVLGEPGALAEWRKIRTAISSELLRVEALRTIDRARIRLGLSDAEISARRADVLAVIEGLELVPLGPELLARAADPFPTLLRTLDALHLASAVRVQSVRPTLVFATHDLELAIAARAIGLRVIGA